ncbi:MAG: Transcriptional regulator, MarR family [Paenibacillaceae bacterium]|nr:Transcriptional regulator, MarR family [Paenibacillaceae bacterium]
MEEKKRYIGRHISLLYRYGQMFAGERLKRHGVGSGQYIFLNALYRQDGINQEALSDYLKIDKGTTAKAVKKLEAEGYVVRTVSMEDKRSYEVHLTDKAKALEPEIRSVLLQWRSILTEGFTETEKEHVQSLLERMSHNAAVHMARSAPSDEEDLKA